MNKIWSDRLQCVCSTVGFERKQWSEDYYPDDCPLDWRVAYFMNDFRAVYLTDADWFDNYQLIELIVEELEDDFELVLQWPSDITPQVIRVALKWLAPLERNIACMVIQADAQSPASLKQCLQALARFSINLDCSEPVNPGVLTIAREFDAGFVWRGDEETQHLLMGDYQHVVTPCSDLRQATAMLRLLQTAVIGRAQPRIGVFLEAAPQSPQRALELRTVIELMRMV